MLDSLAIRVQVLVSDRYYPLESNAFLWIRRYAELLNLLTANFMLLKLFPNFRELKWFKQIPH